MTAQSSLPSLPSKDEMAMAQQAHMYLQGKPSDDGKNFKFSIPMDDFGDLSVTIPAAAADIMLRALESIAAGHAVDLCVIKQELPVGEAARLLGVSDGYIERLIETGAIPSVDRGWSRKVLYSDLLAHKESQDKRRLMALEDLSRLSQELGLDR